MIARLVSGPAGMAPYVLHLGHRKAGDGVEQLALGARLDL
jgi:hypothetical protein